MMTEFLLYTIVALTANAAIAKILHVSIQPGQWLDKLLDWQRRLYNWDIEGKEFLAKAGGYCELCFSHMVTFVGYWCYVFFVNEALGYWICDLSDGWVACVILNLVWYLVYIGIGTNLSLYFIIKLFNK